MHLLYWKKYFIMIEQIPLVDAPQNLSQIALIILFEAVSENLGFALFH